MDDGDEELSSFMLPAPSIGAISAITGVSCFTDQDDDGEDDIGKELEAFNEPMSMEPLSLISDPSSPAMECVEGPRSHSEPMEEVGDVADAPPSLTGNGQLQRRFKGRRRQRRPLDARGGALNYESVTAAFQNLASATNPGNTTAATAPKAAACGPQSSRVLRKASHRGDFSYYAVAPTMVKSIPLVVVNAREG